MTVRIGTNPIAWSNDDMLELGRDTSLETCLSQARAAGFSGIELGNKFPRKAEILDPILKAHDIKLVGGWYSTGLIEHSADEEISRAQDHMTLLKEMGCSVFIMAETTRAVHGDQTSPLSGRPHLTEADWGRFSSEMSIFSDYLRDQGFLPAYHHHMGTVIETAEEIDRFMAETRQSVGLLLDAGHATFAGADPVALAEKYANRITHVHCKDIRLAVMRNALAEGTSFLQAVVDGVFTVPGDGDVDFPAMLGVLSKAGYEGWLVVEAEQDPKKADPEIYANLGSQNLYKLALDAGFNVHSAEGRKYA